MLKSKHPHIIKAIKEESTLSDKTDAELKAVLEEFMPNSGLKMKS
jgi:hypothetical protein